MPAVQVWVLWYFLFLFCFELLSSFCYTSGALHFCSALVRTRLRAPTKKKFLVQIPCHLKLKSATLQNSAPCLLALRTNAVFSCVHCSFIAFEVLWTLLASFAYVCFVDCLDFVVRLCATLPRCCHIVQCCQLASSFCSLLFGYHMHRFRNIPCSLASWEECLFRWPRLLLRDFLDAIGLPLAVQLALRPFVWCLRLCITCWYRARMWYLWWLR